MTGSPVRINSSTASTICASALRITLSKCRHLEAAASLGLNVNVKRHEATMSPKWIYGIGMRLWTASTGSLTARDAACCGRAFA